uniref:Uncharacterized protein n=1 Tax=Avena sativa TaxID=4498 RepID=A0ACD5TTH6_AVESA
MTTTNTCYSCLLLQMESSSSSHQEFPVPLPCLVVDHDGAGGEPCTTLLDISKGEYQYQTCANIDVLQNRQRWVTPQGWVLSWDPSTFSTFLWSPQTSEKIALPSLTTRRVHKDSACCLSDKPTSNTGFTVVVADQDDTVIWYCHVGGTAAAGSGWVRHEYHLGIYRIAVLSGSMPVDRMITWMAAYQGKFYFIKSGAELGVLEFSLKPVITSLAVPSVNRPTGTTDWAASCVELDGELYLVAAFLYSNTGYDTSVLGGGVYRLDFEARRWRTVQSIGDRAFVMGWKHFGGWCAATISGLRPNCVYWMGLGYNMNLLHVFGISGGTYEVHNPCKGIAGRYCNAVWMLPTDP